MNNQARARNPTGAPATGNANAKPAGPSTSTPKSWPSTSTVKARSKPPPASGPRDVSTAGLNLAPCRYCGRKFDVDRLSVHERVCIAAKSKKRKPYDSTKHRLAGTDAESILFSSKKKGKEKEVPAPKPDWRQRHKELQETARNARAYSAHIAAGGKPSDLPPPPPSENRDYVPCPYCGRRFNQSAAERHIPICKNTIHNKPKMNLTSTGSKTNIAGGSGAARSRPQAKRY